MAWQVVHFWLRNSCSPSFSSAVSPTRFVGLPAAIARSYRESLETSERTYWASAFAMRSLVTVGEPNAWVKSGA